MSPALTIGSRGLKKFEELPISQLLIIFLRQQEEICHGTTISS
jgi:hypothetical protein